MARASSTILITGGTSGLGYEAALFIAQREPQAHIILASRSNPNDAASAISKATGHSDITFKPLDLGSLDAIRTFVGDLLKADTSPINVLFLNAGLQFPDKTQYSQDGYEKTFGVNHLGHALLFHLLYPHLQQDARVIVTASGTHDPAQGNPTPPPHYTSAEQIARPTEANGGLKIPGVQRYTDSKLCNVLWTYALQRRLEKDNKHVTVVAFDPGFVPATGLVRDHPWIVRFVATKILPLLIPIMRKIWMENIHTPQESGDAMAWLAVGDVSKDASGKYFEGKKIIPSSKDSYKVEDQEDLWRWTIETLAKGPEEKQIFQIAA